MRANAKTLGAGAGVAVAAFVIVVVVSQVTSGPDQLQMEESPDPQRAALMAALLDNASPALGDEEAPITLVEFGDYQCHFCNVFFHNTKDAIVRDYIETGLVRMVFKDRTIIGPDSVVAAHGASCAVDQGLFWEYHDTVYANWAGENTGWASLDNLRGFAADAGLDEQEWSACMESSVHSERVAASNQDARSLGVGGTPSFFVIGPDGNVLNIQGAQPYEQFARVFDGMLEG